MKTLILFTLLLFTSIIANAQCDKPNYDKLIREGDQLAKSEKYINAVRKYIAATIICPDNNEKTQQKIVDLFNKIEALKAKAEKNEVLAIEANNKAQKIIDALYFYAGKYALAYKEGLYGFINKQGNVKINYKYNEALPFSYKGLSKVRRSNKKYMIDTTGTEYLLAEDIKSLTNETQALDLSEKDLNEIPAEVFNFPNLKILILESNNIAFLSADIGKLQNLIRLDLYKNKLSSLPVEMFNLKSLTFLVLSRNQLSSLPPEIGNLTNLNTLVLSTNQLSSLPPEIGNLQNLEDLFFEENKLTNLPPEVWNLKKLIWNSNIIRLCAETKNYELAKKMRKIIMQQKDFVNIEFYADLAWWSILAQDFEGAIWAGNKCIEKGSRNILYLSNLATAYLWNGDYEKAREIYIENSDQLHYQSGLKGKQIFLQDISDIQAAKIIPKKQEDVDKIKKLLQE